MRRGTSFGQIRPVSFFPVGGVAVEDDVAEFPESRLFCNERNNVVILRSDEPQSRKYEFLNGVLDLAEQYNGAEALYTINGIASMIPHTATRRVFLVANDPVMQRELRRFVRRPDWPGRGRPIRAPICCGWPGIAICPASDCGSKCRSTWRIPRISRRPRPVVSLLGRIFGWDYDFDDLDQRIDCAGRNARPIAGGRPGNRHQNPHSRAGRDAGTGRAAGARRSRAGGSEGA